MKSYYSLAPDISVIDMKDGNILFKSDTLTVKLDGESTRFLVQSVLPLLTGENDLELVCSQLKDISADDLRANLDQLVKAGVLRSGPKPVSLIDKKSFVPFFDNFLETTGNKSLQISEALAHYKIAVIGLEAHGSQTLLALLQAGFSSFKLIDPFPCDPGFASTFPFLETASGTRQESLKKYIQEKYPAIKTEIFSGNLEKETLEGFVKDCQLLVVCIDKGFTAAIYWANQVSIDNNIPALYASIKGHICNIGPHVIPGKTSCYMCYKMRSVSCLDDFEEAMLYEEFLNGKKQPSFNSINTLPGALNYVSAVLSGEVIKSFFALAPLTLPDKIIELNTLSFDNTTHSLLQKPGCPVCQKKKFDRTHLGTIALIQSHQPSNLGSLLQNLVSTRTGIIKKLEIVPKDISEPTLPLVYLAELANHTFLPKDESQKLNCSGKGMNSLSAKISAGGEAVERYSGTIYLPDEIKYESFNNMAENALDPRKLVLYAPHQYSQIDFSPFDPNEEIGWVTAWSLVKDKPLFVPAHSTIMNYSMRYKQEYLCQATSNGLAAGSTLLNAILSAAGEVVERDAFMIAWHNRLPCKRIDPMLHPSKDVKELCVAYRRRGVELHLYKLPTDTPFHVFIGLGLQVEGDGPTVVVGLGADFSAAKAARGALLEVGQVRPAFKQRLRMPKTQERLRQLLEDPNNVEDLEDHDLLYGVPDKLSAFDFLFSQPMVEMDWNSSKENTPDEQLKTLIHFLKNENSDLIYCNLTPPDMEQMGLFTARVIIPDFQPIHFGYRNIRLGGNRLFELPQKLGFSHTRINIDQLNSDPHPLA